jgi:hypothetical protein
MPPNPKKLYAPQLANRLGDTNRVRALLVPPGGRRVLQFVVSVRTEGPGRISDALFAIEQFGDHLTALLGAAAGRSTFRTLATNSLTVIPN